ncbi:aldo/keto reductase [Actinomyces sp.]
METNALNDGVEIPQVGLGTYLLEPDDAQTAVTYALDNGYTLIDTANVYVNERAVGRGMRASSKSHDQIFLETKLCPSFFERDTEVDETLERLGVGSIDLMILHHPAGNIIAGYRQLEATYNIALQAWYPLGGRGKSPTQVLLRWHIQQGHIAIPGSRTPSRIAQNIDLFDFALTDEDMAEIDSLDKGKSFFEHNDEVLAGFLTYVPDVDGQK